MIVDQLLEGGISEFIFIVGYLGTKIQDYVKDKYPQLKTSFVFQNERQGIGQAVLLTKELVARDEIFIVLGDTICEYDIRTILENPASQLGIKRVDDPRDFGVAEIEDDGFISRVVEKPQIPKSNMALVGIYKIRETDALFSCLENNIRNQLTSYGEYNLTDAIECMIGDGVKFRIVKVQNWFDCGKKETLLESNAKLLKKFGSNMAPDHHLENTIVIHPVNIASGCTIKNSIIGPNVAIGEKTNINYSILKDSIIGSFANLFDIVLTHSLIGSDTEVRERAES
ncbi:MAG: sugar phosphate nucleotidyltransferase [Puia sp.]